MPTRVELLARAKKMGYTGLTNKRKADIERHITTIPPPKPPRTKTLAQQKENARRLAGIPPPPKEDTRTFAFGGASQKKDSNGKPIVEVPKNLLMNLLRLKLDEKNPKLSAHPEAIKKFNRTLRNKFKKMVGAKSRTLKEWGTEWRKFISREDERVETEAIMLGVGS